MGKKKYITAQQLLEDSFQLGLQILESGFRPSFIVGVWRGGAPVGIAVQEFLDYFGLETDGKKFEEISPRLAFVFLRDISGRKSRAKATTSVPRS